MRVAEILDLELPAGTVRVEATGQSGAPLTLFVHGLSANLRGFDAIVAGVGRDDRRLVAVDLRGRGRSPDTGPGTYGLDAHARDVVAIADALGAEAFDYVGWSMGGLIGLELAALAGDRVRSLTLIDIGGATDPAAVDVVRAGLARLDAVVDYPEDYVAAIRSVGVVDPWEPIWDGFYRYELRQIDEGRWTPATSRRACEEDLEHAASPDLPAHLSALYRAVTMPALLVRALRPLGAGGLLVPDAALATLTQAIPQLQVAASARNHWTVMTDPVAIAAIDRLIG